MPISEHEPGGFRDRCGHCGGWISLGHAEGSDCRPKRYYCMTCWGDGKLSGKIAGSDDYGDMKCPDCNGTGTGPGDVD